MKTRKDETGAGCLFCRGGGGDSEPYSFYAGFCVDYQEKRAFMSNTVHIRAKYRDLKRYSVPVCQSCSKELRGRKHLPSLIRWGGAAIVCGIAAFVVWITNAAGDQNVYVLGICGLFGVLTALVAVAELTQLVQSSGSGTVTVEVLERVKKDPEFKKIGDSFFGPEEYKVMFKDAKEEPLTEEELLAGERPESDAPKRKKAKARDAADVQTCPNCRRAIPGYAEACPSCKTIIG